MRHLFTMLIISSCSFFLYSQELTYLELVPNQTVEFSGTLEKGVTIEDLSWAWNSSVACFPQTVASQFRGVHVLYMVDVPRYSELEIKLIPADESADYSLYAYQVGKVTEDRVVPQLSSCIRCEADYSSDRAFVNHVQDHTRTVRDILAINNPYQAVIAVVGPPGMTEGEYKLQINMSSR